MGEKEVVEAAVRSFNEWQEYKADVTGNYDLLENCASVEDHGDFLKRITVNYIRHNLTEYDNVIENTLRGKTGKNKLWFSFQKKIYDAIAEAYPVYAEECERQFKDKQNRKEMFWDCYC